MSTRPFSYHPVLILLGSIIHCCVPGVGAAGIDFANIKHPVPAVRQKNKVCRADERKQVGADYFSDATLRNLCKQNKKISSFTYFVGLPKAMLSSCKKKNV